MQALIGFETIASDAIGAHGRFQIDTVIPVAGKGVIVGTADDGATLRDVVTALDDLRRRINYL